MECGKQILGNTFGLLWIAQAWDNNGKLIASQAGHQLPFAKGLLGTASYVFEQAITCCLAKKIIHFFEVIQAKVQHGQMSSIQDATRTMHLKLTI